MYRTFLTLISAFVLAGDVDARGINPATLTAATSGHWISLREPVKIKRTNPSGSDLIVMAAGRYVAEYVSDRGVFYRGPKGCLVRSSYSSRAAISGIGFQPDVSSDCGIVLDRLGVPTIYEYSSVPPGPTIDPNSVSMGQRRLIRSLNVSVARTSGLIFVLDDLGDTPELVQALEAPK